MNYWGYAIGYGYLAALIGVAELLCRKTRIPREIIRKLLHCFIGAEWLVLYYCFSATWQIVMIPASFVVVNALTYRFRYLHALERTDNNHLGIVYYAVAMTTLSVCVAVNPQWMLPFGAAVFALSFGDCAAALFGLYLKPRIAVFSKTLFGVLGCFLFSILGVLLLNIIIGVPFGVGVVFAIAVVCALTELLSIRGTDNLFVCLWCALFAYCMLYEAAMTRAVLMCYGGFLLFAIAFQARAFTGFGAAIAGVMLAAIGLLGGWFAYIYILAAYAVIYLAEKVVGKHAAETPRTALQVLQNGFWPFLCVILYAVSARTFWLIAYAVGITQSLADSFASCVGMRFGKYPVDILTRKPVANGLSGGITLQGTFAALGVGLVSVIPCGYAFGFDYYLIAVGLLPFFGTVLDSIFGSCLQRKYICAVCGEICETTAHCGRPTKPYKGFTFFSNGNVNLVCNFVTTGLAALCLALCYTL